MILILSKIKMNLETIKKRIFENIVVECFDIHKNGYSFVKKTSKIRCEVGFSIEEDYLNNSVKAHSFWASIAYPEMENILHYILAKNDLFGKFISTDEISSSFFNKDEKKIFLGEIGEGIFIKNDIDLENLISKLQVFFSNDALPFFEKWKDLSVLYEYIKDKESREELSEILGQFWQFKKATILRLCNDPNYQSFMDNFVKRREEILALRPDSVDVQRYYNASKELKEVLDKTKPIYNV